MKYCVHCGAELHEGATFCTTCGCAVNETTNTRNSPSDNYNTLAVVGFVLSFFLTIVGLILSIVAYNQIQETGEKGKGLALAGIIISVVEIVLSIIFIFAYLGFILAFIGIVIPY